ncbi:MAG: hypothetical protein VKK04_02485 [Synechococcales bacterium]|nr:hypothetical protein [Synechococcales bacterium]
MQTLNQRRLYEELELISRRSSQKTPLVRRVNSALRNGLRSGWREFLNFLTPSPDPRISTFTNAHGETIWRVYDPVSQQAASLSSESELRVWLEQRYNR